MSLFIGKDIVGDNILHITKGNTSLIDLKSTTILTNTLFHSKLPIMTAKIFQAVSITYINSYFRNSYTKRYDIEFSVDAINYLLNSTNIMTYDIVADGNVVTTVSNYNKANGIFQWYDAAKTTSHNQPFSTAKYVRFGKVGISYADITTPVSVQLVVYNIDVLGNITPPFSTTDRSILINNSTISIGLDNMLSKSYVSNTTINNVDYTFTDIGGITRQLLNSSGASGSVEIKNTANGIEIYNGSVKVFDTAATMMTYKIYDKQTLHKNYGDLGCGPTTAKTWKLFDIPSNATDLFLTIQSISSTPATINFSIPVPLTATTIYYMFAEYISPYDDDDENRVYIMVDTVNMVINMYITPARGVNFSVAEANYTLTTAGRI